MKVLDPCCGSKMMFFDKEDERVVFGDKRHEQHLLKDRHYLRKLEISPDVRLDFTALPFPDNTFPVVVFDPPHLIHAGEKSWLAKKYGVLGGGWQDDIRKGFAECFRVLKPDGVLIFKWNENQIRVHEILALTDQKPLFGHVSMKHKKNQTQTHWITFLKEAV
ncbi:MULTISPECIES: class I SAM-dependent methyltransferase [unclassified Neisseria]|uniref:class I SAM-dependent methyltransferase n=1 Tax=unclassified Neisseria TaxID=2623750 RepID=UPI001072B8CC|nr:MULTISPECIES: methyltransferase domain-containing protein [unclassified Neisseria]TFV05406.1 methyltransferase domain-containing protein [Bacillus stratosphericus]